MNSREEEINSENIIQNNKNSEEENIDDKSIEIENKYKFGWSIL